MVGIARAVQSFVMACSDDRNAGEVIRPGNLRQKIQCVTGVRLYFVTFACVEGAARDAEEV